MPTIWFLDQNLKSFQASPEWSVEEGPQIPYYVLAG